MLVERGSHGVPVLGLFHRQFLEVRSTLSLSLSSHSLQFLEVHSLPLPLAGLSFILELAVLLYGTNPSTVGREIARAKQSGPIKAVSTNRLRQS